MILLIEYIVIHLIFEWIKAKSIHSFNPNYSNISVLEPEVLISRYLISKNSKKYLFKLTKKKGSWLMFTYFIQFNYYFICFFLSIFTGTYKAIKASTSWPKTLKIFKKKGKKSQLENN